LLPFFLFYPTSFLSFCKELKWLYIASSTILVLLFTGGLCFPDGIAAVLCLTYFDLLPIYHGNIRWLMYTAMLPFCGYNMADYFRHWLYMGLRMIQLPKIFHVNWFRTDKNGKSLWPGYGENLRVIEWILARCRGEAKAMETPIGFVPTPECIDLTGLDFSPEVVYALLSIIRDAWIEELKGHSEFFIKFGKRLPLELWQQYQAMCNRFGVSDEIPLA
jgi:hypothetical protein